MTLGSTFGNKDNINAFQFQYFCRFEAMYKCYAILLLSLVLSCLFPLALSAQSTLQKMLDETNDGDTLYIERKDYISENSVTLSNRKNLTLIFEKGATVICSSQFQDIFVIQNCSGIQFYNGVFKHQSSEEAKSFGSGFYLFQSQNIRIINADLDNNGLHGLFAQNINNLELIKCLIHNNSASAFLFQELNKNIVLKGNKYENNGLDGDEIFTFKKITPEIDPYESIEESTLSVLESNRMDSIFRIQNQMFPKICEATLNPTVSKIEYDSLHVQPLEEERAETYVYPGWLEYSDSSSKKHVWLNIPDNVKRYLCQASGLETFDTRNVIEFFKYDEPAFTNMSPKAFLKGIQNDVVYLNEFQPTDLHWNCDPELEQMVLELKSKNIQQIAEAQETVVYRLLQVWEKYQTVGLLYEKLQFEIIGNCHLKRSDYHSETEMLDATLSLNDQFLATLRIPITPTEFKQLFFNRDDFSVYFKMKVHPGFNETTVNTVGKNLTSLTLPNLEPIENPSIKCMNQNGMEFTVNVYGLNGQIWSSITSNKSYQSLLLGGMVVTNAIQSTKGKITQGKNVLFYKSVDIINRIVKSMEYYSKSLGDCYFGLANNGQKMMESIFPIEQKDKQYMVYTLENQSEADIVKKALIAKGLHFAETFALGQVVFCYTRQLK
jgi:hypothetical protein